MEDTTKEATCHTEEVTSCRKSHHPERVKKGFNDSFKSYRGSDSWH